MGNYDHILQCQDGDKDVPILVPLAGWTPQVEGSGRLDDAIYGFDIVAAEVTTKGEAAKTAGKNLHLTLRSAEPSEFANVTIQMWHGIPVGSFKKDDGTENVNFVRDLARLQSIVASIKSGTPGALEQAVQESAKPVSITPRALEGRRLYARTRIRKWTDKNGNARESSEVWYYVVKAEFDAHPGPDTRPAPGPIAQTERPEVASQASATQPMKPTGNSGGKSALDQALGL